MRIDHVEVCNFRNYEKAKLDFHEHINVLYGDNAQGKTNILESLFVSGTTKSHKVQESGVDESSNAARNQFRRECIPDHSIHSDGGQLREGSDESDLPSLQSIQLGNNALQGDSGDKRKMITEEPYNYRNTMTMRSEILR